MSEEQYAIEYMKLMDIYYYLCGMQNIPDIEQYAFDWMDLARRFDAIGATHSAGSARGRGEHYQKQAGGEYLRIIEGSFSELIAVEVTP